ncbi:hypothetical protein A3C09_03540 [Candidatus Uhrbacteria bacterium RIFCSPHIGHO2_02_FULL_47_44]|uniref:Addiction module toxin, HicA family n=1 Tax=Candidatus Uhrbacteria bacterium RIFCSPLOWO2_02_FULL_48_18 TaxID=1802408 RepID=A0A1F7V6W4_9BACT|nr:MAG: hypothetical protein A2839_05125 [Candidatus Uhrbacteria bacterium RIFCSPHIGHO2_01_FULL_47_10]OGL71280.1 MAG: hypothetical protein A3C09_03540 [Candidatus Uhrbacteria bacterium RIFCSPHIGHO2_02_FULL_47_44]OGL76094.1 MAG: hypothetical protein A3E97_02370 [Candidatus Uhrbacteria bacterium RIFCSPHIGHO2_12_FULL_47_12]OGL80374.1 MAG: hypothetical protein A3B20_03080 [Candidatus Uhrbacteria bacterium RIFCSPLOWO2_01_FULL_47_17]OGL86233.1 MAG: hypothetical protein A3I41_01570 [Candidatus Uhrbact
MSDTLSGRQCITILCREFGFFITSQKGSHVKLRKTVGRIVITTIVPLHKELSLGTLRKTLKLAEVDFDQFSNYY